MKVRLNAGTRWGVVAYLCAIAAAAATAAALPDWELLWRTLAADVVGTLVLFAFRRRFATPASRSVGPMVISACWAWHAIIEKRSFERRPDYRRYADRVGLLIPRPPRR